MQGLQARGRHGWWLHSFNQEDLRKLCACKQFSDFHYFTPPPLSLGGFCYLHHCFCFCGQYTQVIAFRNLSSCSFQWVTFHHSSKSPCTFRCCCRRSFVVNVVCVPKFGSGNVFSCSFQGVTFSDKFNGHCKPCRDCGVNIVKTANCTVIKDTKCSSGQYPYESFCCIAIELCILLCWSRQSRFIC